MAGIDPRELRELLEQSRAELARMRGEVTRIADDVSVVRARVDDLLVATSALAQLDERRHELELAREQQLAGERTALEQERAAREQERIEARRWWRTSVLERVLVPALTAAIAFGTARLTAGPQASTDETADRPQTMDGAPPTTEAHP